MTETFERGGPIRLSWQDRFRFKWPYMTTMMYQGDSSGGIDPYIGQREPQDTVSRGMQMATGWPHQQQSQAWTDHEKTSESSSAASGKRRRGCNRACNIALCAFLLITIITAACAGIGLAVLLNSSDTETDEHVVNKEIHLEGFLSPEEEIYMSRKFCDLVKALMKTTNYPLKKGMDHCYAVFKLLRGSEEMHIELHVLPADRYTMKEKFRRALRQRTLAEGSYRINGTDRCVKTIDGYPVEKCTGQSKHPPLSPPSRTNKILVQRPVIFDADTKQVQPSTTTFADKGVGRLASKNIEMASLTIVQSSRILTEPVLVNDYEIFPTSTSFYMMASIVPSEDIQLPLGVFSSEMVSPTMVQPSRYLAESVLDNSSDSLITLSDQSLKYVSESAGQSLLEPSSSNIVSPSLPVSDVVVSSSADISPRSITRDVSPTIWLDKVPAFTASGNNAIAPTMSSSPLQDQLLTALTLEPTRSSLTSFDSLFLSSPSSDAISLQSSSSSYNYIYLELTPYLKSTIQPVLSSVTFSSELLYSEMQISYISPTIDIQPTSSSDVSPPPSKQFVPIPFQNIAKTVPPPNNISIPDPAEGTSVRTTNTQNGQPKVIENLMLGGVLKLPFKTTSRFKFLFSNNGDRSNAPRTHDAISDTAQPLIAQKSTTSKYRIITGDQKAKIRFDPPGRSDEMQPPGNYYNKRTSTSIVPYGTNLAKPVFSQAVATRKPIPPPIFTSNGRNSQRVANTFSSNELNRRGNRFVRR